ncbi:MAG: endonuclease III [Armatimonadetes bacterium]|nr:endonuclease III [Armatimonadota bacterium]MDW8122492.1 endonuclease III [Armatimonadota bacterium]
MKEILRALKKAYPKATTELRWQNPFELLIATILSAQATDKKTNDVTKILFARYPDAPSLANARLEDVEAIVKPLGFFRQKSKTIIATAKKLVEEFGGEVPKTMEEIVRLPGVWRKTGAIVLGTAFGINEGIAVDTHVHRVAHRLGLTDQKQQDKVESDLMALVKRDQWSWFGHALTLHGRYVCVARKPLCHQCVLEPYCPKIGVDSRGKE